MRPLFSLMRRAMLVGCLALASVTASPYAVAADELRLSLEEARAAAARLLRAGRAAEALALADGVLIGAPGDVQALLLKARAEQELGKHKDARKSAKLAWNKAEIDRDRFFAAMVQAGTLASDGNKGIAQYWLRRAAQVAPETRMRNMAVSDFRKLRRLTPWRLNLALIAAPSDNLNGGPTEETSEIGAITYPNPNRPLSGFRYGASIDFSYRYALTQNQRLKLGVELDTHRVELSDKARERVPSARNRDYSEDSLGFSLGYERRGAKGDWLANGEVFVRHNQRAGEGFSNVTGMTLFFGHALGQHYTATARTSLRHERLLNDDEDTLLTREAGVTLARRFQFGKISLAASAGDTLTDIRWVGKQFQTAQLSIAKARPVMGVQPRLSLGYQRSDYDEMPRSAAILSLFTGNDYETRLDEEWSLSLDLLLPKMDLYGFAPEIGITVRDRESNYDEFDSQTTDLRLGIKSVF
ncbi:DUF560 domain-containing protein [Tropicibacter sp. R15_0]|uniref:surface lipoprotein assembly modifier n=1 Tax=Tropicibacter sp. R15_0 TaxID=2821101 RepID=UPI001ADA1F3E|nr:surface lipoprotein assembly modifier [Tropicibacter sp. R15_0]MBO9465601.1 DUF560 domain-containing protein [Tropicibacter sp. R15_0]